jgi:uncharacterized small protein (DUF1192 family)
MKNRLLGFATLSMMLVALLAVVVPVGAQNVDQRIQALETELTRLKAEQQQVKTEQMELKKAATAAEEKLPTFEYEPGEGVTITAADKSWSANFSIRVNVHSTIYPGDHRSHAFDPDEGEDVDLGATSFELAPRRNRFYFNYCWDDCFYQFENSIDGETGARTASPRDSELYFRFDQWNPYLPYLSVGVRRGAGATHISRSSDSDANLEHNMLLGWGDWGGDGSHAGIGLVWDRVPVGMGDFRFALNYASSQQGTHAEFIDTDHKGFMGFFGVRPFSKMKEAKWIQGLEFGWGLQYNTIDSFVGRGFGISTHEERGGQDIIELDGEVGDGWSYVFVPGMKWRIGPYQIRGNYHRTQTSGKDDDFRGLDGKGWNIANQIFLWSPKGFLTGSPSTAGSLLLGFNFERVDVTCGVIGCNDLDTQGTHKRATVLNREIELWYWIRPALRIGTWAHFWHTSNTPDNVQVAVGCKGSFDSARAGKGTSRSCDWWTWNLGIQYQW